MQTKRRRWLKNENTLIARYVNHRDEQAFAELYGFYQPILYRFACQQLHDEDAAEELTQDAFLRIARHLHRFDRSKAFSTWAFTILANLCKNRFRLNARHRRLVQLSVIADPDRSAAFTDSRPDPLARMVRMDDLARVDRAIRHLTPDHREMIEMRLFDGMTYEDMAEIAGIPVGTVKSRLSRAKIGVRDML